MSPQEIIIPRPWRLVRHALPQVIEASLAPVVLFDAVLVLAGAWWALMAILVWSYGALGRRLLTGRRVPGILLTAALLLAVRTATAFLTGSVFFYFLQPVLGSVALAVAFAASVPLGRPLLGRLVLDFCPLSPELMASPPVKRIFSRLTLAWAAVHLFDAVLTGVLLFTTPIGVFVVVKVLSTYTVTAVAVIGSIAWGRRAARHHGITIRLEERAPALGLPEHASGEAWKLRDDRRISAHDVGATVRELREKRLTQEESAMELGITKQRVGQIESTEEGSEVSSSPPVGPRSRYVDAVLSGSPKPPRQADDR